MKSLYIKFFVITIGIMIISSVFAFLISNTYYQQKLKPYNDHKITRFAESIAAFADEHPTINLNDYLDNISSVGYQIYLVDGRGDESFLVHHSGIKVSLFLPRSMF